MDHLQILHFTVNKKKIECMSEASHAVGDDMEMIAVVLRIRIRGREVRHVAVGDSMVANMEVDIFPDPDTVDAVQKQPEDPNVSAGYYKGENEDKGDFQRTQILLGVHSNIDDIDSA